LYNFRASTIQALLDKDFRVICIAPYDSYSDKLVNELGATFHPIVMDNQGSNPVRDANLIYQFWKSYRKFTPAAALHFTIKNNVYGTWAARLTGVPAINIVSGLGTAFIRKGFVSYIVRLLYRASQPLAHQIFCQNEEDLELLTSANLVPRSRIALLPGSGVDLKRFTPELRESHDEPFRFLYAGRMLADKGLYELIEAVNGINSSGVKCSLWLSGFSDVGNVSAITQSQLTKWGEEPGIKWLGASDAMENLYPKVDCVVLPSYREGMPRSLLEAGAMGLPVIATDVPGCRNIVEHGFNGLLCKAKDSDSLAQSMLEIMAMTEERRKEMGVNARKTVSKNYDEQLVIAATLRSIELAMQ